jgi:hypothetical protein
LSLYEEKKTAGSAKNETASNSGLAGILLDKVIKKEYNILLIAELFIKKKPIYKNTGPFPERAVYPSIIPLKIPHILPKLRLILIDKSTAIK